MIAPVPPVQLAQAASPVPQAQSLAYAGRQDEAERLLRPWLASHPQDEDARFLLARVLTWQRRWEDALEQYDFLLARAGQNADYVLGRARVLASMGRPDEALAWARRTRALAPGYVEAWQLELQLLEGQGRQAEAKLLRLEAERRFPGASWLAPARPAVTGPLPWRVAAQAEFDYLTNNYQPWTDFQVSLTRDFGRHQAGTLAVRDAGRFGLQDPEIALGGSQPIGDRLTLNASGTVSPGHHVLPFWALGAGAYYQFDQGWGLAGELRETAYTAANSTRELLVVDKYLGAFRLAGTLSLSELPGAPLAPGGAFTLAYRYGDRNQEALIANAGKEMEFTAPGVLQVSDVFGLALAGENWLSPRWGISHQLGIEVQGANYTRIGLGLGAIYAF